MPDVGRAVRWAERVTPRQEHGLAELENQLLRSNQLNFHRLRHPLAKRPTRQRLLLLILGALATGPLLTLPAFFSGRSGRTGHLHEYDALAAHRLVSVGFIAGLVVLAACIVRWWRQPAPRVRSQWVMTVAIGYSVCAVFILYRAFDRSGTLFGDHAAYLIPVWAVLVLAALALLAQLTCKKNPLIGRMDVTRIHPEDREWLLRERGEALRVLGERGLLSEGLSVAELNARPLGRLHLSLEVST